MLYLKENEVGVADTLDKPKETVLEDEVDQLLRKKSGKIQRERDPQL